MKPANARSRTHSPLAIMGNSNAIKDPSLKDLWAFTLAQNLNLNLAIVFIPSLKKLPLVLLCFIQACTRLTSLL